MRIEYTFLDKSVLRLVSPLHLLLHFPLFPIQQEISHELALSVLPLFLCSLILCFFLEKNGDYDAPFNTVPLLSLYALHIDILDPSPDILCLYIEDGHGMSLCDIYPSHCHGTTHI